MHKRRSALLQLEALEDRALPSVSVLYSSSILRIAGVPRGTLSLARVGVTGNNFQVKDNNVPLGTYALVGDVQILLQHEPNADVNVDLNGGRIPGNLLVSLGTGFTGGGFHGVNIFDSSAATPVGSIGGSVIILGGNGQENYNIGAQPNPNPFLLGPTIIQPVTINGDLTIVAKPTSQGLGDNLNLDAGSRVGGSVTTVLVDSVGIGSPGTGLALTTVGGNVSTSNPGALHTLSTVISGNVGGNVNVVGTEVTDTFTLQQTDVGVGGIVGGSITANLGGGIDIGNNFNLAPLTEVDGNVFLATSDAQQGGNGTLFNIGGTVNGSLTLNLGNGDNIVGYQASAVTAGNLNVTAGNGNNHLGDINSGPFTGAVNGNLTFQLGSGDNGTSAFPNVLSSTVGGVLRYRTGNGNNSLQLGDGATPQNLKTAINFGNGDDTLTVNLAPTGNLSGYANGGGAITQNIFDLISPPALSADFTLYNF